MNAETFVFPAPGRTLSVVTGGAGFIGQHLVKLLLAEGHRVRVLDLNPSPGLDRRAEFHQGSILNTRLVREVFAGADYIFHLAADPNLWARDKRSFGHTNFEGTRIVLEEAGQAGARRIVHCSTESILKGIRDEGGVVDERVSRTVDDMPGPYCRSKFLAERAAFDAAARGLPVVIVNPTLPIGPGDHRITPPTRMILDFLNGVHPAYLDFDMNLVDVRDAAQGHWLAALRGVPGERYILGGENLSLGRMLEALHDLTGLPMPRTKIPYALAYAVGLVSEFVADWITRKPPKATLTGVRLAGTAMHFDGSRARRELGLAPRPAREALAEAVAWLQREGRVHRTLHRQPLAMLQTDDRG